MPISPTRSAPRTLNALLLAMGLFLLFGCANTRVGESTHEPAASQPDRWPTATGGLSTMREDCDVLDGTALPGGAFVFALTDPVLPDHAPVPRNRSERVVFAHLYETLVNVTCDGRLVAGLATNWTCTEDSTTWVFTLRKDEASYIDYPAFRFDRLCRPVSP